MVGGYVVMVWFFSAVYLGLLVDLVVKLLLMFEFVFWFACMFVLIGLMCFWFVTFRWVCYAECGLLNSVVWVLFCGFVLIWVLFGICCILY